MEFPMRHKAFARAAPYHPQGKQISSWKDRRRTALLFDGHNSSFLKSSLILWGPWHSVIERNCVFYACLGKADLWFNIAQAIFQHCTGAPRPEYCSAGARPLPWMATPQTGLRDTAWL